MCAVFTYIITNIIQCQYMHVSNNETVDLLLIPTYIVEVGVYAGVPDEDDLQTGGCDVC